MSELRQIINNDEVEFGKIVDPIGGELLVPVWAVDAKSLAVDGLAAIRMSANANKLAVDQTFATNKATFWSRSRQGLWVKGEESGNFLIVRGIYADCDMDALIYDVNPVGPTCHTGSNSCFEALNEGE